MVAVENVSESTDPFTPEARHIVVVSGGLGDPSQSAMLAKRLATATTDALSESGVVPEVEVIELRLLATDISNALIAHNNSPALQKAIDQVMEADGVIAVSPTFKASYSGLFKSFWDLVDEDEFAGTPVLLGATGGTARHSLVIDQAMRPLFAYLKALVAPMSVFAASDDWGLVEGGSESTRTAPIQHRISQAGEAFANLLEGRPARPRKKQETETGELEVIPFEQLLHG
ncbi:CE1759 family FMN reductase [Flaviflexus massiliensis]|uniref:CE1759 family FMN reductase n=1 Tax=Flaviflexus massiliensis TaxID=1522309 RepID=UPI0006D56306|nr:CE1759 family FMN reductase [Flaviflexus massiliensis]